jgi:hypothetical protein
MYLHEAVKKGGIEGRYERSGVPDIVFVFKNNELHYEGEGQAHLHLSDYAADDWKVIGPDIQVEDEVEWKHDGFPRVHGEVIDIEGDICCVKVSSGSGSVIYRGIHKTQLTFIERFDKPVEHVIENVSYDGDSNRGHVYIWHHQENWQQAPDKNKRYDMTLTERK